MRWFLCALVFAFPASALAGDFDVLRGMESIGPATFYNWSGFYIGGQFGYGDGNVDFSKATQPLVAYSLRELSVEDQAAPSQWPVLSRTDTHDTSFGGYVGYNTQWQDLIIGVEANYNHTALNAVATDSPILNHVLAIGSNDVSVNLLGTGSLSVSDYGSLRARAGWILGNFLPYGFVGVAAGVGNYNITSMVYGQQNISTYTPAPALPCNAGTVATCVNYSFANSAAKNDALLYGFSVGGGLDVALTRNVFLRSEFEYIQFAPVAGITAAITTGRVGAGIKF